MAARDYLIALRSPVLWLLPTDEGEGALLDRFLSEAPSPVPVTGAYDEWTMVASTSRHGHWMAAFTWPNAPLTAGNLTVLAGVPVAEPPRSAALDPDRVLATLGSSSVATIFYSDGDSLGYQMDHGFFSFDPAFSQNWPAIQGHRVGWTMNPALVDLAPIAWRHYLESADQVTLVGGFAGAGYAFPQLMGEPQLAAYLDRTAAYLERTGLRALHIFTGRISDEILLDFPSVAAAYHQHLGDSGYLGAYTGVGSPVWGLNLDYVGVPAPGVAPMAYSSVEQILADLPDRRLDDFTILLADWPTTLNNVGKVVNDATGSSGRAVKYASTVSTCCLGFATGPQHLLGGDYTARIRLKVADNGSERRGGRTDRRRRRRQHRPAAGEGLRPGAGGTVADPVASRSRCPRRTARSTSSSSSSPT